jgi:hypothetical protein
MEDILLEGDDDEERVMMTKKQVPTDRENARSIARWEGEGGARKSPSEEERDSRKGQVVAERRRTRRVGDGRQGSVGRAATALEWCKG